MRVFIVDDEPLARARLTRLLSQLPEHQCIGEAETAEDAWSKILRLQPEVILLDIEMPEQDGISLGCRLSSLPVPPAIIFTTAHPRHALDAFQASPVDYLLKPVSPTSLFKALDRVGVQTKAHIEKKQQQSKLTFKHAGIKRQVFLNEIIYFSAEDKYVRMVTLQGEALLEQSLTHLEQQYPEQFMRIHRQSLVNIAYFKRMFLSDGQHWLVLHHTDIKIQISRRAVALVKNALLQL